MRKQTALQSSHQPLRSKQTALDSNCHLGWVEITHPFHPRCGHRFKLLTSKNVSGTDILSLRDEDGSLHRISREWTSLATPSPFSPTSFAILHFEFLLKLAVFLEGLDHAGIEKEVQEKELQNG
jgi:hypothetical protein